MQIQNLSSCRKHVLSCCRDCDGSENVVTPPPGRASGEDIFSCLWPHRSLGHYGQERLSLKDVYLVRFLGGLWRYGSNSWRNCYADKWTSDQLRRSRFKAMASAI